jgi:hypothetical protein
VSSAHRGGHAPAAGRSSRRCRVSRLRPGPRRRRRVPSRRRRGRRRAPVRPPPPPVPPPPRPVPRRRPARRRPRAGPRRSRRVSVGVGCGRRIGPFVRRRDRVQGDVGGCRRLVAVVCGRLWVEGVGCGCVRRVPRRVHPALPRRQPVGCAVGVGRHGFQGFDRRRRVVDSGDRTGIRGEGWCRCRHGVVAFGVAVPQEQRVPRAMPSRRAVLRPRRPRRSARLRRAPRPARAAHRRRPGVSRAGRPAVWRRRGPRPRRVGPRVV